MSTRRLLGMWEPPQGFQLASVLATTYELQADFLEEDLLPTALGLRQSPAAGRAFRLELEYALQDAEVSIFFHPDRYRPGLRRTPRIDLIPMPESRCPKLHAKVALLRFVRPEAPAPERQLVRLVIGSANLTAPGYRSNIEVAAALDDAPGESAEVVGAVRDAARWLEALVGTPTEQYRRQMRDIKAVFAARPVDARRDRLSWVGLPISGGVLRAIEAPGDTATRLTIASPFWPSGDDMSDVVGALQRACGGRLGEVRLIGQASVDKAGRVWPVMPTALVAALMDAKARVFVAAADPHCGIGQDSDGDDAEFDGVNATRRRPPLGTRSLHAKVLLFEGQKTVKLAVGSFNLTRRGLGLIKNANAEAGLVWTLPASSASVLAQTVSFATPFREVTRAPRDFVKEPKPNDEPTGDGAWPSFLRAVRARRDAIIVEGDSLDWPGSVTLQMRDIRARLLGEERWFDDWVISDPPRDKPIFEMERPFVASWLAQHPASKVALWSPLADFEVRVRWGDCEATVPVIFEDKHFFPVVEAPAQEDEQALIAWFLGLRESEAAQDGGFGHSIDPVPKAGTEEMRPTHDILSYLVRDFVHALPGIKNRLQEASVTETGLRAALLGPRSPVALAREAHRSLGHPEPGKPRKTVVAAAFQLVELHRLLAAVTLPELPEGVTEMLRGEALGEVAALLLEVSAGIPQGERSAVLVDFLRSGGLP